MKYFYLKKFVTSQDNEKKEKENYCDCVDHYNEWYDCIKKNRSLKIEDYCLKLKIEYLRCLNKNK
jgi:hypothetical protein